MTKYFFTDPGKMPDHDRKTMDAATQQSNMNKNTCATDIQHKPTGDVGSMPGEADQDNLHNSQVAVIHAMGMTEENEKNLTSIPLKHLTSTEGQKPQETVKETLLTGSSSECFDHEQRPSGKETALSASKHQNAGVLGTSGKRTLPGKVADYLHISNPSSRQWTSDDLMSEDDAMQKQEHAGILRKSQSHGRGKGKHSLDEFGFVNEAFDSEHDLDMDDKKSE